MAALLALPVGALAQRDTATSTFEINGLKVILRRNTANEVIAANVYLLGGTQQLSPATQGMEALLLASSERGTRRYPKEAVRQAAAAVLIILAQRGVTVPRRVDRGALRLSTRSSQQFLLNPGLTARLGQLTFVSRPGFFAAHQGLQKRPDPAAGQQRDRDGDGIGAHRAG